MGRKPVQEEGAGWLRLAGLVLSTTVHRHEGPKGTRSDPGESISVPLASLFRAPVLTVCFYSPILHAQA